MECSFDVGKILQNLSGDPREQLKWPHEAYWPGKIAEPGPCPPELGALKTGDSSGNKRYEVDVLELRRRRDTVAGLP